MTAHKKICKNAITGSAKKKVAKKNIKYAANYKKN
jgi:hypothetical protein